MGGAVAAVGMADRKSQGRRDADPLPQEAHGHHRKAVKPTGEKQENMDKAWGNRNGKKSWRSVSLARAPDARGAKTA